MPTSVLYFASILKWETTISLLLCPIYERISKKETITSNGLSKEMMIMKQGNFDISKDTKYYHKIRSMKNNNELSNNMNDILCLVG